MALNPDAHAAFEALTRAVIPSIGVRVFELATLGAVRGITSPHCLLAHGRKTPRAEVMTQEQLKRVARDHGFTDRQIVDITRAAAVRNYFSRSLLALAVETDEFPGLSPEVADALLSPAAREYSGREGNKRVGALGADSNKSGRLLPPLEKLQELAELAVAVPVEIEPEVDVTDRSWLIRRRLTDAQVEEIVKLYQSGVGTPALCNRFNISKPSVLDLLHDHGVRMRRQPLTKQQRARAIQLYEEGLAIKPIAETLGSSFGAVHRVLKAEGIKLRPRPGR